MSRAKRTSFFSINGVEQDEMKSCYRAMVTRIIEPSHNFKFKNIDQKSA